MKQKVLPWLIFFSLLLLSDHKSHPILYLLHLFRFLYIFLFIREYEITNRKLLEALKITQNMEYLSQEQMQRVSILMHLFNDSVIHSRKNPIYLKEISIISPISILAAIFHCHYHSPSSLFLTNSLLCLHTKTL